MHPPVWEGLESYLAGKPDANMLQHLAECSECRVAVTHFQEQSEAIRALKPPAEIEPAPGFYSRVLERIETQKSSSIWSVFLEPLFARRLMYASAVLTLLLGMFLFTSPKEDDDMIASSVPEQILAEESHPPADLVDSEQDRNTVLVQLTTYQE
jgi:hypothetical protein